MLIDRAFDVAKYYPFYRLLSNRKRPHYGIRSTAFCKLHFFRNYPSDQPAPGALVSSAVSRGLSILRSCVLWVRKLQKQQFNILCGPNPWVQGRAFPQFNIPRDPIPWVRTRVIPQFNIPHDPIPWVRTRAIPQFNIQRDPIPWVQGRTIPQFNIQRGPMQYVRGTPFLQAIHTTRP